MERRTRRTPTGRRRSRSRRCSPALATDFEHTVEIGAEHPGGFRAAVVPTVTENARTLHIEGAA